jgi:hypothetical protein
MSNARAKISWALRRAAGLLAQALTLLLLAPPALGQPQMGPNGNYYEVVLLTDPVDWPTARAAAEQRIHQGRAGHLATLTSEEEDVFAEYLRQQTPPINNPQLWVGGYQSPLDSAPKENWFWVNGEGPTSGVNGGATYSNWIGDEPNDYCGPASENHLTIGLNGNFGWNDEGCSPTLYGYLVEYDALIVGIDIKPGSATNPINLDAPGKVPVAILTSATFDAATVDRTSITFGRYGTEAAAVTTTLTDVNGDKRKDLVCQFEVLDCGFLCGDRSGMLRARTTGGTPFRGSDALLTQRCPPYNLSLVAWQDVNHVTDLQLNVNVILPGEVSPTAAQSILLKSYDLTSRLAWTKTLQSTALTPIDAFSSSVGLQYADMHRGQRVRAQMVVPSSQSSYVLHGEAVVLLRPDLAVERIDLPSQANIRQVVNIPAYLRELNGDLGATADVFLMEGDTVLDVANNVTVPPLVSVAVVFAAIIREAGPHSLRVVINNVNPGDYDLSNNAGAASLEVVVPALQTADYSMYYNWTEHDYFHEYSNPHYINSYSEVGKYESFNQALFFPVGLRFPIGSVSFKASSDSVPKVDVEIVDIEATYTYDDGCFRYDYAFRELGDNLYLDLYSYSGPCNGDGVTYAYLNRYAADVVVFSAYHDLLTGEQSEYTSENRYGAFLDATSRIDTRMIVTGDAGAFGGNASLMDLFAYPFDIEWDYLYDYGDGWFDRYRGHDRGTQVYGFSYGQTTP